MTATISMAKIIKNIEIKPGYFLLTLLMPKSFCTPLPGQFVMIRPSADLSVTEPFLARPVSVCGFADGQLELLFRVVGSGTLALSKLIAGNSVSILGPLGNCFLLPPQGKQIVLIAGGIGVAPLLFFAAHHKIKKSDCHFLLGAKRERELVLTERLAEICTKPEITTDDGSVGSQGFITNLLEEKIATLSHDNIFIYACGPKSMLKSIAQIVPHDISCEVSVEERMACGIGACLGCAVKIINDDGNIGMKQVCKNGPVFDIKNISWE